MSNRGLGHEETYQQLAPILASTSKEPLHDR